MKALSSMIVGSATAATIDATPASQDVLYGEPVPPTGGGQFSYATLQQTVLDIAPYAVSAALIAYLAWPMLTWWAWEYTRPESYYAHAPLIPFMMFFMLWRQRDKLKTVEKRSSPAALLVLLPMILLLTFSVREGMRAVESVTFLAVIWSCVWFALGAPFVRAAFFPLAFLLLMAPLPGPLLNDSTLQLQMLSTTLASAVLKLATFPNTHVGNMIQLENFTLLVDVPCSGFKTLLALMTFNAFLAFMLDGTRIRRILLFFLCAPLALLINGVRIALIGAVGECLGTQAAHIFHDYSGLITLVLGFIILFSIAKVLGCRTFAGWAIF